MKLFATDMDKLAFLAQAEVEMQLSTFGIIDDEDQTDEINCSEAAKQTKEEQPTAEQRPKYITNYIGSKQKLIDWIWANTPDKTETVLDAFSGSAVVGYMYKSKGLCVLANDRLRYSHHAAKAIIENNSTRLSETEIEELLSDNAKAGTFVHDNFKGIFFAKGVHAVIDNLRANCDKLSGHKKDIALFALGKACMSGKGGFGHFSSSTDYGKRQDSPDEFKTRFKDNLNKINALVFDNGKENKAYNEDVNALLTKVKADLAYFDPPYATEFSTTNYEKSYHFVEGLMTYWEGLTLKTDTKVKSYETDHETVTKANANNFFQVFLNNASHIPNWLISYRDHAYPNEQEMKKIIGSLGRQSRMKSKDHKYSITSKHGEASNAVEHLFICQKSNKAQSDIQIKQQPCVVAANFHTAFPVDLGLNSQGMDTTSGGDPQFSFILCRTGTNRNGDHFTAEELSSRHLTVINKKVDLQHSQDFSDIVGGIIAADFLEDEKGGRVECIGELYIRDSQQAQLAYKLMKRGIIAQVSMECDYAEGECSICGKRFQNKADYCTHLRKFKGSELDGKPVFEILHGVTFTGLGLLDRKGADENARILQVASVEKTIETQNKGDQTMDDKTRRTDEHSASAARKKQQDDEQTPESDLEKENKQLKAQITELQKRIDELEAEQKAAACRSRAKKLLTKLEKQGIAFANEDERENELKRLAGLSDDAFAATEKAFEQLNRSAKSNPEKKEDENKEPEKTIANSEQNLRSNAGIRPHDVDDCKSSLEDRLRNGFMAAYLNRVGEETNDTVEIN